MTTQPPTIDAPVAMKMVIGGESVDAADGQTFEIVNPATGTRHRHRATRWPRGCRPGRRGGPGGLRRSQGLGQLGRRQARPKPREVRGADEGPQRGTGAAREPERGQADHGGARRGRRRQPRLRLLRGGCQQDLRPDDPGVEAWARHHAPGADRRRRADRALELPDPDGFLEGGAGAGCREHRDPEARLVLTDDRDPPRRARRWRPASRPASSTS